jgi:cell wall-associated NlpC family hydrolase
MVRSWLGPLTLAASLAVSACGARGGHVPRPFPVAGPAGGTDAARPRLVDPPAVVATALALRGAPYAWGGATPKGFDCSGFTHYVYAQHGVSLPRIAAHQYRVGASVGADRLQPGDLVFFSTLAPGPSHVGLALGDGRFVHAPSERGEVRVESLGARYWQRRYLGARRIASEHR